MHSWYHSKHYFTELTCAKAVFYVVAVLYVLLSCLVCVLELFVSDACNTAYEIDFQNPLYQMNPCRAARRPELLFLTKDECSYGRRLVCSVLFGGVIGWERREADRPAGIRTMSLVSLGSCLFTINSTFAFLDGPMTWDASRVSAAIPSGVGFLGAGLIFKEAEKDKKTGDTTHVVHGLTTAASLWLSAAAGVACGGQLYFPASFGIALMLVLLRFGPRYVNRDDDEESEEEDDVTKDIEAAKKSAYSSIEIGPPVTMKENEGAPLLTGTTESRGSMRDRSEHRKSSIRKRANLGSVL